MFDEDVYDFLFFFFQAEDGIRDGRVTGVQTCALPICKVLDDDLVMLVRDAVAGPAGGDQNPGSARLQSQPRLQQGMNEAGRSEERRVGKSVDLGGRRISKKKKKSKEEVESEKGKEVGV